MVTYVYTWGYHSSDKERYRLTPFFWECTTATLFLQIIRCDVQ